MSPDSRNAGQQAGDLRGRDQGAKLGGRKLGPGTYHVQVSGVGVGAGSLEAWSNPALLAGLNPNGELVIRGSSFFDQTQSAFAGGAAWRVNEAVAVGGIATYSSVSFDQVDVFGNSVGTTFRHSDLAAGLTAAAQFDAWQVGATLKEIVDALPQDVARATAADLGVMAGWNAWTARVAVRNIGSSLRKAVSDTLEAQPMPTEIRVGVSAAIEPAGLLGTIELASRAEDTPIAIGCAWSASSIFILRFGSTDVASSNGRAYTLGFSYRFQAVTLEYCLVTQPLGLTNHAGLVYSFQTSAQEARQIVSPDTSRVSNAKGDADRAYENAVSAYQGGDYSCAIREAETCVESDPMRWQAWQFDGNARMELHDVTGALTVYEYSLKLQPDNRELEKYVEQLKQQAGSLNVPKQ